MKRQEALQTIKALNGHLVDLVAAAGGAHFALAKCNDQAAEEAMNVLHSELRRLGDLFPRGRTVVLTFKRPDAVSDAVEHLPEEEREWARQVISRWVKWGEFVKVEISLDSGEARVLPAGR